MIHDISLELSWQTASDADRNLDYKVVSSINLPVDTMENAVATIRESTAEIIKLAEETAAQNQ